MKHIDSIGNEALANPDDVAIDRFAAAMKAKMAKQRVKGYGGWDDPKVCPTDRLQQMLADHLPKGDPVDVANFAMMLWIRCERTAHPAQRNPLTDGWILGMWPDTGFPHLVLKFARAIEAAHGIKGGA